MFWAIHSTRCWRHFLHSQTLAPTQIHGIWNDGVGTKAANKTYRLGIKAWLKHGLLENLAFTVIQSLISYEYLHLLAMFPLFVKLTIYFAVRCPFNLPSRTFPQRTSLVATPKAPTVVWALRGHWRSRPATHQGLRIGIAKTWMVNTKHDQTCAVCWDWISEPLA